MTIHDPSLRAALKTLKLTGMLDTLDARQAQTRDGKIGHLEFLQVLCEDEIARRETAALARRVHRARFEQHNTFEDFDLTAALARRVHRARFEQHNTFEDFDLTSAPNCPPRCCATWPRCAGWTPASR
jgi:DNA replication protein DnaC